MNTDLRLPSGEQPNKEDNEHRGVNSMFHASDMKLHNGHLQIGIPSSSTITDVCDEISAEDGENPNPLNADTGEEYKDVMNLEPLPGMEFETNQAAYSFYQEYARCIGFSTAIQNSRRSKTSREFIDAKFACSRYGTKREYDNKSVERPRSRKVKQDPENGAGRRACGKTDCKASMHIKRRSDGKWVIHSLVKEHNHELLPAQAVSEQTRQMYATMARQFTEYKNRVSKDDPKNSSDKGRNLPLESEDVKTLLDFFSRMQSMNSNFFYAVDIGEDHRLNNLFWVDPKSRHDYANFYDVVSFDTTHVNKCKMPLALFFGVNNHYQMILLGCALISGETGATYSWLMQTWLKAMGGQAPKVIITDHDKILKSVVYEVFPDTYHHFYLWNILLKVSENLGDIYNDENFTCKFEKCVYSSSTELQFVKRWRKLLDRFQLRDDEYMQSLYEDRKRWAPTYLKDVCLAGMSAVNRSESVNSFFDKFVHKKTTVQEFVKQYESILQDRYEEEAKADSDSWNKQPLIKSPSPFEKILSSIYTNAVFKKFQFEVVGAVACHPKNEGQDGTYAIYKVQDFEKHEDFIVLYDPMRSEISCMCRMYEYKGYLCRHALVVFQIQGLSSLPSHYILKRWTKDAKSKNLLGEETENVQSRVQRFNGLCFRGMKLSEEGSLSQESYNIAIRALEEAFGNCVILNTSNKNLPEAVTSPTNGLSMEDDNQSRSMIKANKKRNLSKKKKVNSEQEVMAAVGPQDGLEQMEKMTSRPVQMDTYYGTQQTVPGMVQLNLMDSSHRDNYYGSQQTIQGLGQLNSLAPNHGGYYGTQQSIPGLGQMDFFRTPGAFTYGMRDDPNPNARTAQLHEDASRHHG